MKRSRHPSSSDESDNGSNSTCWSQHSSQTRRGTGQKPSEVFRTDLITAMKLHDSYQLNPEDYYILADSWRQEWEKGVQVPVSPQSIPQPVARVLVEKGKEIMFVRPKKLIRTSGAEALGYVDIRTLADGMCRYDLDEEDVAWLHNINQEFVDMALPPLDEMTMERVMEEFEHCCYENMTHAVETEEGLGIEYDEDVVCDVCRSPDGEDNNEMVFCDKCNICVHQACYGIQKVPEGSWLCRICALGILPKCQLCPKKGGAMKPTRSGTKWVHVSCALWIPEVSIGNPEKMEPITNVSHIPSNRWALICCLCKEKSGACIQCSAKNCRTAFHVTCGLHASLEMNTLLTEEDEVKFKSFCPKHSGLEGGESRESGGEEEEEEKKKKEQQQQSVRDKKRRRGRLRVDGGGVCSSSSSSSSSCLAPQLLSRAAGGSEEKRVSFRKLKLQEMEEEFYQFVEVQDVAARLKLLPEAVDFLFQYWKLKRKANFNQPLLTPKKDEEESLARREQEVLRRRLQLFTHLRQDLERVRNLTYMVTRREKMKRSLWKVQEQIFQHQIQLLDQELLSGDPSAKDLEKLFSLSCLSPQPNSSSGLKNKRSSLKPEKRKSTERRRRKSVEESPHTHRKESVTPEMKEEKEEEEEEEPMRGGETKIQTCDPIISRSQETLVPKLQRLEVVLDTTAVKLHRNESRKGVKKEKEKEKEALGSKMAAEQEEEERQHNNTTKNNRLHASKHLEKTVSIRLVDIRSSDSDDNYFLDDGTRRRINVDVTNNTKASTNNGWLRKNNNNSHNNNGHHHHHHLKTWGKFKIPKRNEKVQMRPLLRTLGNTTEYPRTRHRTGMVDNDEEEYNNNTTTTTTTTSDSKSDGELEPCLKRCHSHQLRGDATMNRRYGSDIIRRGVLAS